MPQSRTAIQVPQSLQKLRDFQQDEGSVFEPGLRKVGRWLSQLLPSEPDPTDAMNPLAAPASVAVSAFMKPGASKLSKVLSKFGLESRTGRVPNVQARQQATAETVEALKDVYRRLGASEEDVKRGAQFLEEKYPRIAAHLRRVETFDPNSTVEQLKWTASGGDMPDAYQQLLKGSDKLGVVRFNQNVNPAELNKIMTHELTHQAQAIGDPKFSTRYEAAKKAFGYTGNPYEVGAEVTAQRNFGMRPELGHIPSKRLAEMLARLPEGTDYTEVMKHAIKATTEARALKGK